MTTHQEAAEQLRVIRTMMERATIFRALSAGVVEGKTADSILHELMTLPIEHRA